MSINIIRVGEFTAVRKHFIPHNSDLVLREVVKDGKTFCFIKSDDEDKLVQLDYSFPTNPLSGIKPYLHQKITTEFIVKNPRCLIANSQGTGKSLASLHAVDYLIQKGEIRNCLYVGPKSILLDPIGRELETHFNHLRWEVALGAKSARLNTIKRDPQILAINWDGLTALLDSGDMPAFDMIIYDEASALKNPQARRYKQFFKYVNQFCKSTMRLVLMSGTPAAESPLDAFSLIKLINSEGLLEKGIPSLTKFREALMYKPYHHGFRWLPKPGAEEVIYNLLTPAVRFTLEDAVDLPPLTFIYRACELTKEQSTLIKLLKKDLKAELDGGEISAVNAAVLRGKFLQILCGAVLSTDGEAKYVDNTDRYNTLLEIIEETDGPVVVFSTYKAPQELLLKKLSAVYPGKVAMINGDLKRVEDRTAIFKQFEAGEIKVLLAHPKTVSHGSDFTRGNVIVYYSGMNSVELYLQGIDRIRRLSSVAKGHKKFLIYHLWATGLEEDMFRALKEKPLSQEKFFKKLRSE